MKTPRLNHRLLAERLVREVLAIAETRGSSARETRRMLRARFASTTIGSHVRYAAVKAVAGVSMLDLPDARQPELLARGPRRRTQRKKLPHAA